MSYKYQVYSPDGIEIAPESYTSYKKALHALAQWCKRFQAQGYYRDNRQNKIAYDEIIKRCDIVRITSTITINNKTVSLGYKI